MADKNTNTKEVDEFFDELEAGSFKAKVQHMLREVALGQIIHGGANRKGKVAIELSFHQVGDNNQIIVTSKITYSALTKRGAKAETATNQSPFFVAKGGVITVTQPTEEFNGQFSLVQQ